MTDEQIVTLRRVTEPREGRVHWMYLDTIGLVTCGIGHMLPDAEAAAKIRFAPASAIRGDFARVKAQPFGYKYAASYFERFSTCRISDEAINELFAATARTFVSQLVERFPGFGSWPWPAQQATFDMIYSLGMARLKKYTHMLASLDRQDFRQASAECFRHGWNDTPDNPNARNRYTRDLYLEAAGS